jgi:hypothetical protein
VVRHPGAGDSRSSGNRVHDEEAITMLSQHQLADEMNRERLAQAAARRRGREPGSRRNWRLRMPQPVLRMADRARVVVRPRTQAGSGPLVPTCRG